jgi:Peptidase A4 family
MHARPMITPVTRARRTAWLSALLAAAACVPAAAASAAPLVSSNWSGYAARARSRAIPFQSVSGEWLQPAASCRRGRESYVGVWVGLGGYSETSRALEQVGTDSDCTRNGQAVYATWYELVPAQPVQIRMAIHAGDVVAASVTVRRHDVTLRIRDRTTGARFSALRRTRSIDVSSAEWIVEAPSTCLGGSSCATLPLTDFGTTTFTAATATAAGRTAEASDPGWSTAALELRQSARTAGFPASRRSAGAVVTAAPSPLSPGGSFSVAWAEERGSSEATPVATNSAGDTVRFQTPVLVAPGADPR